ncbi:MAG: hypothetical protein EOO48_08735 [Flavobacterium sp.]|nr:MAG: hypothetical protein EOO48_08735 [Flavobacterium sp.]
MGLFGSKTKQLIEKFRKNSVEYSNDLSKEIEDQLDDLKSDYEETSLIIPEFQEFVANIKGKLAKSEADKLEEFSSRLAKLGRSAKKGVMAMWELSYSQRKMTAENLLEYEELE